VSDENVLTLLSVPALLDPNTATTLPALGTAPDELS
jgi:hypothetical protein